jgi:hypothetical protein
VRAKFIEHPAELGLWRQLEGFEITPPHIGLTFESRLAREQNWGLARALAVTQEYRKFLFLLLSVSHPVTPSEDVDAAWHLHLLYTRSYYDELCQKIAGRMIHHGPTAGGVAEGKKFFEQYQQTLQSYNDWFGVPPMDIWPSPENRFRNAGAGRWFNPDTHYLIPRLRTLLQPWFKPG